MRTVRGVGAAKLPFTPSGSNKQRRRSRCQSICSPAYSVRHIVSAQQAKSERSAIATIVVTADSSTLNAAHDFELSWQPTLARSRGDRADRRNSGEETYALIMVTPPARSASASRVKRSSSIDSRLMEGASMRGQAALLLALGDLKPATSYNIIDFDFHRAAAVQRTASSRREVDRIGRNRSSRRSPPDGGTEMLSALQLAMPKHSTTRPARCAR